MTSGAPPTAIDVAIVNWNTSEAALAAADAFLASTGVEARVTVVDNLSEPSQRSALEEGLPSGASLEMPRTNLGYGAAVNLALAAGEAELVCASNADVLPEPAALAELARVAVTEPRAGMVGPAFREATDRYHAELPSGPDLLGQIFAGSFGRRPVPSPAAGEVVEAGQPSGACFLIRREVWDSVGGFDEGFFLWFEDVDLARRLVDAGRRNLLVGSARVDHATAGSFRQLGRSQAQEIRRRSLRRYIDKHHPRLAPAASPLLRLAGRR